MRRTDGILVAACALALAALVLAGPAEANSYDNGFQMAKFKVEVKGVQTTVQQHTKEAADECDYSDFSSGSEEVVFRTTKPTYVTATYMPGMDNPEFLAGRQLGIPTKARVKRSWTPRVHGPAIPCEENGGGVEIVELPDCGTKTVRAYEVRLQYARQGEPGLMLSGNGDQDPFERCPSASTMGFPWLLTENQKPRDWIVADLSQKELFDPGFRKWISIAEGEQRSDGDGHWAKTHIRWEVSFTRLKGKP